MELKLQRDELGEIDTPGTLFVDGHRECRILEDPVREIPNLPISEWKIPEKTAFSAGRYRLELVDSPNFGPDTIAIVGVPGYDDLRIHGGNNEINTKGCPLTGTRLERDTDGSNRIPFGQSKPALEALKAKIVPALKSGEEVWLSVYNPPTWYAMHGIEQPVYA